MKILVIRLSALGDLIHTLPAVNALKDRWPEAGITWAVEAAAAPLLDGHPALAQVHVSHRKDWLKAVRSGDRRASANALREMTSFIRTLRSTRYDLVIDFQHLLKSGVLAGLARGQVKAGFGPGLDHAEGSYWFLNHHVPAVSMEIHALTRNLILADALGAPTNRVRYRLPVTAAHRRRAARLLAPAMGRPLVAIHPAARWTTKRWPEDRFAALAAALVDRYDAAVAFTGSGADRASVDRSVRRMRHPAVNLAGRTGLLELAAVFERARGVIATDTGPMHLAAAMDTPVVALFGPTAPWRTGPFGPGHRVVRAGLPCGPCFRRRCPLGPETACMDRIRVADVTRAVSRTPWAISMDRP